MCGSYEKFMDRESSKGREPSEKVKEILEYIERHKKYVGDSLSELLKESRFILVGESHAPTADPLREEVASSLARLRSEGLTHVALEANSAYQRIIDSLNLSEFNSDSDIIETLRQKHVGLGWSDSNFHILIEAKKLGLKVLLIDYDDGRPYTERDNASYQNLRDEKMFETINSQIDGNAKVLIFIGNAHVHKKEVRGYRDGKVKPLAMRLVEKYGDGEVKSIRYVGENEHFDGLPEFMSQTPTPQEIPASHVETIIIPDQGSVKGDPRVCATDFIVTTVGEKTATS